LGRPSYESFEKWADSALAAPIPVAVVAFSFNIAETYDAFVVELVGSSEFDAEDSDWACEEEFAFREPLYPLPHSEVGSKWEPVLGQIRDLVAKYVAESTKGGSILRRARGVGVGFVDGELLLVGGTEVSTK
jgi:hypothetical protein